MERHEPEGRAQGLLGRWPAFRQLRRGDPDAFGRPAFSDRTEALSPRTRDADREVGSICPYCAVGCGQRVFVKDERITDIEGDPDSPISRGRLCPKGAATFQLVTGSHRIQQVLHRAPHATEWETLPLDTAMEMVADRMREVRDRTWGTPTIRATRSTGRSGSPSLAGRRWTTRRTT
jgi:formate dehydrogenase major subunit